MCAKRLAKATGWRYFLPNLLTKRFAQCKQEGMTKPPSLDPEITTREAMAILNFADPSSVARLVAEHKLAPSRKLPGKRGAYLFARKDVEALAAARQAVTA